MKQLIKFGLRKCYVCKKILPLDKNNFYKSTRKKEVGFQRRCKNCQIVVTRDWKRKSKGVIYGNFPKKSFCEICNGNKKICLDHDHKTGKFRGWLCWRCNVVLGLIQDNKNILSKMIYYLK